MKTSLMLALAATLGGATLRADEAGALTLGQAIDAVVARYPTIDGAQAAIDAAQGRVEQSSADRLPQIAADGSYTHMTLRPYVAFGTASFYETIHDSYDAAITVRQLLTDF